MTIFRRIGPPLAVAAGLAFGAAPAALASDDDKQKQDAPEPGGHDHAKKNPLPEIVDLMRKVEERLADAETGEGTRAEQERIARALEGQTAALDRLKKFIKEIEDCSE